MKTCWILIFTLISTRSALHAGELFSHKDLLRAAAYSRDQGGAAVLVDGILAAGEHQVRY